MLLIINASGPNLTKSKTVPYNVYYEQASEDGFFVITYQNPTSAIENYIFYRELIFKSLFFMAQLSHFKVFQGFPTFPNSTFLILKKIYTFTSPNLCFDYVTMYDKERKSLLNHLTRRYSQHFLNIEHEKFGSRKFTFYI